MRVDRLYASNGGVTQTAIMSDNLVIILLYPCICVVVVVAQDGTKQVAQDGMYSTVLELSKMSWGSTK